MVPSVMLVLFLLCGCLAESEWNPANGVKDLNDVEKALHKIVDSPLLTGAQLTAAKHVVDDVERAVAAVESGKNLTKQARQQQLADAIKELQGLQSQWSLAASGNQTAMEEKLHKLRDELARKQALLNKTQGLLRLAKLQKELAEKKLQLQGLMDAKAKAEALEEAKKERAEHEAVVAKLATSAQVLAGNTSMLKVKGQPSAKSNVALLGPIKAILADLMQRAHKISTDIERADAAEKKREADTDRVINVHVPTKGKADATARGQAMLKLLAQRASRAYKKTRAVKVAELGELNEGIKSIASGDVVALEKLMSKMQHEDKSMQSKTNSFLY